MTDAPERMRKCECGCGEWAKRGRKYFDYERCRSRAYKARVKARAEAHGLLATLSLSAVDAATRPTPTTGRSGYAQNAPGTGQVSQRKRVRKPDLRIGYHKLLDHLEDYLDRHLERPAPRTEARQLLHPLLTERQRAALTGRTEAGA